MTLGIGSVAVFHFHLALEKTLKAVIVEADGLQAIPYSHDLRFLLSLTGLDAPEELLTFLGTLSPHGVIASTPGRMRAIIKNSAKK